MMKDLITAKERLQLGLCALPTKKILFYVFLIIAFTSALGMEAYYVQH
jgi:hypothetical protein